MHRKNPISVLVYTTLFPNPAPTDPPSFSAHLSKNLVGEVRIETATFYGSLDTIEARYPGLNYAHAPHRKRLGRFPHHRKLFDAFDRLSLTDSEIQGFCRWEGTLWARERYERDEGVKVRDTTGMEIGEWVDRRRTSSPRGKNGINVKTDIEVEIEEMPASTEITDPVRPVDTEMHDSSDDDDDDSEDQVLDESVGFALNQRLMQAAALREQGQDAPMDPEWEQYLKDAQERGEHLSITQIMPAELARFTSQSEGPSAPTQPYPPAAPA
jgi:hypothetical protein